MPKTEVVLYAEDDGTCPLIRWLDGLSYKAREKCIVKIERLAAMGFELRRPEADYLRDKIYELRAALGGVQYRMLYFFWHDKAIISHGLIKKKTVPPKEIDLAIERRAMFEKNPLKHTHP
ncbi:MAG: type II toxin-antitoxin system RelE/ParE family toxin [Desulfobacterales bacterium]|nr:type II toxin-antitoxin system RelE/ParE family toxin [Desulfobacterales bacterium]